MRLVVRSAAEVPIIRPPTLVAKEPPVPRRWMREDLGQVLAEVGELGDDEKAREEDPPVQSGPAALVEDEVGERQHEQTGN